MSTGIGPISLYGGSSAGRRRRRSGGDQDSYSGLGWTADDDRELQADMAESDLEDLTTRHRREFPPAQPRAAIVTVPVDEIHARHREEALRRARWFRPKARKSALAEAGVRAEDECRTRMAAAEDLRARKQAELDRHWSLLLANDSATVLDALDAAFADNDAPAAAVDISGSRVSIVVSVPNADAVPDRRPITTAAGNRTTKKMNVTERNLFYLALVAGHVLVTLREAFAVAPGLTTADVAVVRCRRINAFGEPQMECILTATYHRSDLERVRWDSAEAPDVLVDAARDLRLEVRGRTREVHGLDVSDVPELDRLISQALID
jgi:hypothetical protein